MSCSISAAKENLHWAPADADVACTYTHEPQGMHIYIYIRTTWHAHMHACHMACTCEPHGMYIHMHHACLPLLVCLDIFKPEVRGQVHHLEAGWKLLNDLGRIACEYMIGVKNWHSRACTHQP